MHALLPANGACQNPAQFRELHKGRRLSHGARTEQLDEAGVDVDNGVVGLGGIRDERRLRRGRQRLVAQVHRLRRRLARRNVRNYTHLREQFLLLNTSACFQPASRQKRVQLKKSVKSWLGYITESQNRQKHSHIQELFHFLREALAQNAQQAKLQMNRP